MCLSGCYDWNQFRFGPDASVRNDASIDAFAADAPRDAPILDAPSIDANTDAYRAPLCMRIPTTGRLYCNDFTTPPMATLCTGASGMFSCTTAVGQADARLAIALPASVTTAASLYVRFTAQVTDMPAGYFNLLLFNNASNVGIGVNSPTLILEATGMDDGGLAAPVNETTCYVLHYTPTGISLSLNDGTPRMFMPPGRITLSTDLRIGISGNQGGAHTVLMDDVVVSTNELHCSD